MVASPVTSARVKGAAIRHFVTWYIRDHGSHDLEAAIRKLPSELGSEFDLDHPTLGVLPAVWFSAAAVHGVLDDLTDGLTSSELERLVDDAAVATVRGLTTGVQRFLFTRVLTPNAYGKLANLAFRQNYGDGHVDHEVLGERRHKGTVHGWIAHHPFLCRLNVAVKRNLYATMGCKNARTEQRYCRLDGDADCGSVIAWD